jgi:excisionase family DNA binding protein
MIESSNTNTTETDPPVLTVSDVMRRWRCARATVLEAIHAGRLVAFRVGLRAYRVRLDEVERYERTTTIAAASGAA